MSYSVVIYRYDQGVKLYLKNSLCMSKGVVDQFSLIHCKGNYYLLHCNLGFLFLNSNNELSWNPLIGSQIKLNTNDLSYDVPVNIQLSEDRSLYYANHKIYPCVISDTGIKSNNNNLVFFIGRGMTPTLKDNMTIAESKKTDTIKNVLMFILISMLAAMMYYISNPASVLGTYNSIKTSRITPYIFPVSIILMRLCYTTPQLLSYFNQ